VLFLDNLAVHKARAVAPVYEELNMSTIYCAPYSPQYNGIESYWFLIKQEFKKLIFQEMSSS
jgi:transposase